ncbi:hypothetical protein BC833DRAFT_566013 [Globomyces pollinis-pini]|nr:hypothetical protein BC833DRAFT_566013 [Globomyces pollinis-pini]
MKLQLLPEYQAWYSILKHIKKYSLQNNSKFNPSLSLEDASLYLQSAMDKVTSVSLSYAETNVLDSKLINLIINGIADGSLSEFTLHSRAIAPLLNRDSITALSRSLPTQHHLRNLCFAGNYLGDVVIFSLLAAIKSTKTLKVLQLVDVGMELVGAKALGHFLSINTSIGSLDISRNMIGDSLIIILGALKEHKKLNTLDITNTGFPDSAMTSLEQLLNENTPLITLRIGESNMPFSFNWLAKIQDNTNLESLHFERSMIIMENQAIQLGMFLTRNKIISNLSFGDCHSIDAMKSILDTGFRYNTTLTVFNCTFSDINLPYLLSNYNPHPALLSMLFGISFQYSDRVPAWNTVLDKRTRKTQNAISLIKNRSKILLLQGILPFDCISHMFQIMTESFYEVDLRLLADVLLLRNSFGLHILSRTGLFTSSELIRCCFRYSLLPPSNVLK